MEDGLNRVLLAREGSGLSRGPEGPGRVIGVNEVAIRERAAAGVSTVVLRPAEGPVLVCLRGEGGQGD